VPSLYSVVRPEANYHRSLELLNRTKELNPDIKTKSGIMVGLGESAKEVISLMDDLREVNCDMLTIGQYLSPSQDHLEVVEYIHPEQFDKYRLIADQKGFKHVSCGVFVRSSYHASEGIDVNLSNI
jgi:lipoic acid synthetase